MPGCARSARQCAARRTATPGPAGHVGSLDARTGSAMTRLDGADVEVMTRGREPDISPLVEIERAVQERAKQIALDMDAAEGPARLRALVNDEVARWTSDFKRGRRAF